MKSRGIDPFHMRAIARHPALPKGLAVMVFASSAHRSGRAKTLARGLPAAFRTVGVLLTQNGELLGKEKIILTDSGSVHLSDA